jgi:hypothetical protein
MSTQNMKLKSPWCCCCAGGGGGPYIKAHSKLLGNLKRVEKKGHMHTASLLRNLKRVEKKGHMHTASYSET